MEKFSAMGRNCPTIAENFPTRMDLGPAIVGAAPAIGVGAPTIGGAAWTPLEKCRSASVKCRASSVKCASCNEVPDVSLNGRDDVGFLPTDAEEVPDASRKGTRVDEKLPDGWR